jgi:pimeloyl-ACP methyl ester carboxylesterase
MEIYKSEAGRQTIEALYRGGLQRWPVPHRDVTIPTREGATFVIESGARDAPPLVLLHGAGANSCVWIRDVAVWLQHYRVCAVDLIGEPGLSAPSRPPLTSDAYAAWLDDVWDGLGMTRAAIVGVSLGGWMALDYAIRRPARVASLSLISPAGIGKRKALFGLKAVMLLTLGRWGVRRSFRSVAGSGVSAEATRFVTTVFEHFRPRMERIPIRTDAEIAALQMPIQIFVGAKDAMIRSQETAERMRRLVPHARLTYLEHAGHFLPPQTDAIADFVSTASRTRAIA